jgi:hypothetical protein
MTKEEAIQFVQREHSLLENSFNAFYPHYDFEWDTEAEIILLKIFNKQGDVLKTHAIGFEDLDDEWIYRKTHRAIETFMKVHPEWTDIKRYPDGSISWGSSW